MFVDVILDSSTEAILIDTKFTAKALSSHSHSAKEKLRSELLYQQHAYTQNFATHHDREDLQGILLYPWLIAK